MNTSPSHMRPVDLSLTSSVPPGLTAAGLRLLAAMVAQGRRSARDVQAAFPFGYKPVGLLANRTTKIQVSVEDACIPYI